MSCHRKHLRLWPLIKRLVCVYPIKIPRYEMAPDKQVPNLTVFIPAKLPLTKKGQKRSQVSPDSRYYTFSICFLYSIRDVIKVRVTHTAVIVLAAVTAMHLPCAKRILRSFCPDVCCHPMQAPEGFFSSR